MNVKLLKKTLDFLILILILNLEYVINKEETPLTDFFLLCASLLLIAHISIFYSKEHILFLFFISFFIYLLTNKWVFLYIVFFIILSW